MLGILDCVTGARTQVINDDDVYTATFMVYKVILEFVQSSKNIIDADSSYENEMDNAASDPYEEHHEK
ncbi:hypothetical protein TNCV_3679801 [Trichonephila clavipes]|nr:hypothetical protein TNCV_3679801 [Trichonephila clavipes]